MKRHRNVRRAASFGVLLLAAATTVAPAARAAEPLTDADRAEIVERLAEGIEERYVLEERGLEIAARLRDEAAAGRFRESAPEALAEALHETLREIGDDLHFRVTTAAENAAAPGPQPRMVRIPGGPVPGSVPGAGAAPPQGGPRVLRVPAGAVPGEAPSQDGPRIVRVPPGAEPGAASPGPVVRFAEASDALSPERAAMFREMQERFPENYRWQILPGNVGLLEVDILFPPHDRLEAALKALAGTDALLLDLRSCPGGTGLTTRPLESVFFPEGTLLATMLHRGMEPLPIVSTAETPGGVRWPDKPLYVLTSPTTGSACEEVSWMLKYHGRATLVGETTAGAGHAITGVLDLGHGLRATVPSARPVHPRFDGGFERVGVPPDVEVGARRAVDVAHLLALAGQVRATDGAERERLLSTWTESSLAAAERATQYAEEGRALTSLVGSYDEGHRLFVQDGQLHLAVDERSRGALRPLEEPDRFLVTAGSRWLELRIERDGSGAVRGIATARQGSDAWKRLRRLGAG